MDCKRTVIFLTVVSLLAVSSASVRPPCSQPYRCWADPCLGKVCEDSSLSCRADYCSGCDDVIWVDGDGNEQSCNHVIQRG